MSKSQQVAQVLVQFRLMGASVFELVIATKRLMNDEAYLVEWHDFLCKKECGK